MMGVEIAFDQCAAQPYRASSCTLRAGHSMGVGNVIQPGSGTQKPADLLDELDSHDWKRAGSTASGAHLGRSATRVHSPAPANNTILDHLNACDGEIADFIAQARQAPAAPAEPGQPSRAVVYERARVHAEDLGMDWQAYLAAMEWRHAASSALLMGDTDVIRREPCPACGTWGLIWVATHKAAMCVNRYCAERVGPRMWTLAQLAAERNGEVPDHRAAC
ncbi:hypothetical protein [Streptomyces yangpuensis]|uniref:hypothetical protein n=1 Tax=Streptomyces yangpuensis TaxID=1648182 RepID=UPI00364C4DE5